MSQVKYKCVIHKGQGEYEGVVVVQDVGVIHNQGGRVAVSENGGEGVREEGGGH